MIIYYGLNILVVAIVSTIISFVITLGKDESELRASLITSLLLSIPGGILVGILGNIIRGV